MHSPSLLTIILNYRTPEMTLKSLGAALAEMQGIRGEVVVVDNASDDGSFETISAAVQKNGWHQDNRVRVLQAGRNGGFGAGNNHAIRSGLANGKRPDFIYVLNSDAFPDKNAIRLLLDHMLAEPKLGLAGSYIHSPKGEDHLTAFRFPSILGELEGAARFGPISRLLHRFIVPLPIPETSQQVDWVAGASVMIRREMLDQIGLFDEDFFLYFEETDLCLRAARGGWPTYYLRESRVTHIGGASTGMKAWDRVPQYWLDSRAHYFRKNHGRIYSIAATLAHVIGGAIWRLRARLQHAQAIDPPHFLADLIRHAMRRSNRGHPPIAQDNSKLSIPKIKDRKQA